MTMTANGKGKIEADLEELFRTRVRLLGGHMIKLAPMQAGIPDRLVFFPGGRLFLVELKRKDEDLSPIQRVWHARLMDRYQIGVHVLHGQDEIIAWCRAVVGATPDLSKARNGR